MARIFIELPAAFSFTTEVPIYHQHINFAGHLDNAMLLTLVSEARARFFIANGQQQEGIEGLSLLTGDLAVQYLSEAHYGEIMLIDMQAADFNRYGFDLAFRMRDKATGREVARGKLGLVFYDTIAKKVAPIPPAFKERIT